jgi:hypothetical protein
MPAPGPGEAMNVPVPASVSAVRPRIGRSSIFVRIGIAVRPTLVGNVIRLVMVVPSAAAMKIFVAVATAAIIGIRVTVPAISADDSRYPIATIAVPVPWPVGVTVSVSVSVSVSVTVTGADLARAC